MLEHNIYGVMYELPPLTLVCHTPNLYINLLMVSKCSFKFRFIIMLPIYCDIVKTEKCLLSHTEMMI